MHDQLVPPSLIADPVNSHVRTYAMDFEAVQANTTSTETSMLHHGSDADEPRFARHRRGGVNPPRCWRIGVRSPGETPGLGQDPFDRGVLA